MLFCSRFVVRVHRRRRHLPLALVERLPDAIHLPAELERVCALRIAERVAADDAQRAVVAPPVRVSDLVRRPRAAWPAPVSSWPRSSTAALSMSCLERRFDRVHHVERVGLRLRGRTLRLTNALPERFAEVPVGVLHAALPARPLRGDALKRRAVEPEVLGDERRRQDERVRVDELPSQIRLEIVERYRCQELTEGA